MLNGTRNPIAVTLAVLACFFAGVVLLQTDSTLLSVCILVCGLILAASPRMLNEWDRGVLLRLGKFNRILPPGIGWIIPGIDSITQVVDMRIRSTPFTAEKTLTKDTVPVDVDAVLFWVVTDAQRAVLEVEKYLPTISWAAQTTLRDVIGKSELVTWFKSR